MKGYSKTKNSTVEVIWRFPSFSPVELAQMREEMGISISQVTAYTGIHPQTIRRIESGKGGAPALENFYQLAIERLYAYKQGYLPAYRKIGENEFRKGAAG